MTKKAYVFYVVDKIQNDLWLTDNCPTYTYISRPWAKGFDSWSAALHYLESLHNKHEFELETPTGAVWGYINGKFVEVFT